MNTRPFDLEAAKRGEAICRGSGQSLRLVAYVPESVEYPVWCVDPDGDRHSFTATGIFVGPAARPPDDLHMVAKTKTVWFIVIPSITYYTEQAAMDAMPSTVLRTVSVEVTA